MHQSRTAFLPSLFLLFLFVLFCLSAVNVDWSHLQYPSFKLSPISLLKWVFLCVLRLICTPIKIFLGSTKGDRWNEKRERRDFHYFVLLKEGGNLGYEVAFWYDHVTTRSGGWVVDGHHAFGLWVFDLVVFRVFFGLLPAEFLLGFVVFYLSL